MLPAIHQRCLDLQFRFFKTVDDLTKNQGYDRDRKEDIGQQVKIGRCFSGKVHHEVEAGEVVALAHGLGPVAQLHVQLATVLRPRMLGHVPKATDATGRRIILQETKCKSMIRLSNTLYTHLIESDPYWRRPAWEVYTCLVVDGEADDRGGVCFWIAAKQRKDEPSSVVELKR